MAPEGSDVAAAIRTDGLEVAYLEVDVSREDQVAEMVNTAVDRWCRLDILVANAGIGGHGSSDEASLADWNRVIGVNVTGVFLCIKHAVPAPRASDVSRKRCQQNPNRATSPRPYP
jgi:NAD(P)-dependent dehydrogenase (short-subunit alcohol dehydrogenase family)